ncbi:hypothetical protein [Cohnella fermenti]|uniref:Uncharacterized protein n=1 Tax=Cohnella fermenti TaxID=2565925 RepID=A0A4S4BZU4_9BACL|nr:hypothetical protein [Cohnella fermenti]THF80800.1 hypothetical protein E6C55_09965 [Cohnella fermenti]
MRVCYKDQVLDLAEADSNKRIDELNQIFATLFADNLIVQEVVIDGHSYRTGYENELLDRVSDIAEVRITAVSGEIVAYELLQELKDYMPRLTKAIGSISELFYGEMTPEDWHSFSQLLVGINWVEQGIHILVEQYERAQSSEPLAEVLRVAAARIPEVIQEMEVCMEREERVAVGDLIKYELGDVFGGVEQAILSKVTA